MVYYFFSMSNSSCGMILCAWQSLLCYLISGCWAFTIGWKYFNHTSAGEEFSKISWGYFSTKLSYLAKLQNGPFPHTTRLINQQNLRTHRLEEEGNREGLKGEPGQNTLVQTCSNIKQMGKNYAEVLSSVTRCCMDLQQGIHWPKKTHVAWYCWAGSTPWRNTEWSPARECSTKQHSEDILRCTTAFSKKNSRQPKPNPKQRKPQKRK